MFARLITFLITLLSVAFVGELFVGCAHVVPHYNQPPGVMEGTPKGLYLVTFQVKRSGAITGSTRAAISGM